ncbi:CHAT domain-containing protein [Haliangium ochraceum]|uniref:CHAT domain-containing protein n=1 Tax=Haliangium ochraceum (strain DSM 14365 / JCM 11303 / SMP-2) TaxID=502025 RepID=D0LGB5_HALO1|nr:CHAT domain-containing protein [Haliangium ochraceum]ACY18140.1 conserved hypothetical protein [Haliangium ochraceum DSM 14365]
MRAGLPTLALGLALAANACDKPDAPAEAPAAPALELAFAGCAATRPDLVCELSPDTQLTVWARAVADAGDRAPASAPASAIVLKLHTGHADDKRPEHEHADGGEHSAPAPAPMDGGLQWRLRGQPGRELIVRAHPSGHPEASTEIRIELRAAPADPVLTRAHELRRAGELSEAATVVNEAAAADSESDEGDADSATRDARRLAFAARLELALGRREQAARALEASRQRTAALGLVSQSVQDASALAWLNIDQWSDFAGARAVLDQAAAHLDEYPEGRAHLPYYYALLALESGDLRSALDQLDASATWSQRLALPHLRSAGDLLRARISHRTGRHQEAAATLARLQAVPEQDPCTRANVGATAAWVALFQREAAPHAAPSSNPIPLLEEALALFSGPCENPAEQANAQVSLALAELHAGRPQQAEARLAAARAIEVSLSVRVQLWMSDVEIRVARAAGRPTQALRLAQALEQRAEAAAAPEMLWRALLGQADALEDLGRLDEAVAADTRAEAVLATEALRVPVDAGRDSFLAQREQGAIAQIRRLLAVGRTRAAMDAARRARRRTIEALHVARRLAAIDPAARRRWEQAVGAYRREREALDAEAANDWQLSSDRLAQVRAERGERRRRIDRALDEAVTVLALRRDDATALRAPAPGELLIAVHPAPRDSGRWYVFAASPNADSDAAVTVHTVGEPAALLERFDDALAHAERVTLLPYGEVWDIDLHARPWRGQPLIASRPVAYALDLPPLEAGAPPSDSILLVGDPTGDLPAARAEAASLAERLAPTRDLVRLSGDQATGAEVRDALGRATLFYYAGHGRFDGWDSHLPLAQGGRLRIGDILALPRVPDQVVLSGCETARRQTQAVPESLGIAQAFLAAGATQVIAAVRPVDDALAAALDPLRRAPSDGDDGDDGGPEPTGTGAGALGDSADLVAGLQRAQRRLIRTHTQADWPAFRVLIR